MVNDTLTAPAGFLAAGVSCRIKKSSKLGLGLIVCPTRATAAAVFITNRIASASVQVSKEHVKSPEIYAVVVNSGNTNACTADQIEKMKKTGILAFAIFSARLFGFI